MDEFCYSGWYRAATHMEGDARYSCPALRGARWSAAAGDHESYLFQFNQPLHAEFPFAQHGAEIDYFWGGKLDTAVGAAMMHTVSLLSPGFATDTLH